MIPKVVWVQILAGRAVSVFDDDERDRAEETLAPSMRLSRYVHELVARPTPADGAVLGAIAFLRENWKNNDGAEGESVKIVCDELERLRALVAASAPAPSEPLSAAELRRLGYPREV